jgi:hypothetical protein
MAAFVSLSLLGCGGPTIAEPGAEEFSAVSQEVTTCTASCSGGQTVSCSGNTCSAVDYDGVTCDGVYTACPVPTCADTSLPQCDSLAGRLCANPGGYTSCCDEGVESYCVCSRTVPARFNCR